MRNSVGISTWLLRSSGYLLFAWAATFAVRADAGVIVVQNRTDIKIEYLLNPGNGNRDKHTLIPTDIESIRTAGPIVIAYHNGEEIKQFEVSPNAIYYFAVVGNHLQLIHLGLSGIDVPDIHNGQLPDLKMATPEVPTASQNPPVNPTVGPAATKNIYKVPVVILADGSEPLVASVWEKKIRARFEAASDIFEHHCGLRFEIVDVRTWDADPTAKSFEKALVDFERKTRPAPARLAVGFTGRFQWEPGEVHLGGTHGALMSHILIRESVRHVSESEHLEVLVHELGHFLGAIHSADPNSVMRPKLGDQRSRAKSFRIGFDVFNTLAMSLLVEEMQRRPVWFLGMLPPTSKAAMRSVYTMLGDTIPNDPPAQEVLSMLGPAPEKVIPPETFPRPLVEGTKDVLAAINKAAAENHKLPTLVAGIGEQIRRDGDKLTEFYVRRAAAAANKLPPEIGPGAFVPALAIALDDMTLVRDKPLLLALARQVETPVEQQARLKIIGQPAISGRNDLARHFFVAGAMSFMTTPREAESAMLWKELSVAHNGGSFSFAEYDCDLAGCMFAAMVHDRRLSLAGLAENFAMTDYIRDPEFLREEIRYPAFVVQYGSPSDVRFQKRRAELVRQIMGLPVYQGRLDQ